MLNFPTGFCFGHCFEFTIERVCITGVNMSPRASVATRGVVGLWDRYEPNKSSADVGPITLAENDARCH